MSSSSIEKFNIGDLVEVVTNDNRKFKSIVVMDLDEGFISKVIDKDSNIGTGSWKRYGLKGDSRFQALDECKSLKVLEKSIKTTANSTLTLNEEVSRSKINYYTTKLSESSYITFCTCEGFGGWSRHSSPESKDALRESFLSSKLSQVSSFRRD